MTAGAGAQVHRGTVVASLTRASVPQRPCAHLVVPLCLCACLLSCTDPRARPAPPSVKLYLAPGYVAQSPGSLPASVVIYDAEGVDSLHMTLKSAIPTFQGDSSYLIPDTTDYTQSVLWSIPAGIPSGTRITLGAKAWDLLGFAGADSVIVTSQ